MKSALETFLRPSNRQLRRELSWNLLSFGILGVSGVLINIVIAALKGAHELGIFNQVCAYYLLLSQISVGGAHLSTLYYVSSRQHSQSENSEILNSAILVAVICSSLIFCAVLISESFISPALSSNEVVVGLIMTLPGLLFFSVNKVLLGMLNALQDLKALAIFSAMRAIFLILAVVGIAVSGFFGGATSAALSIAEFSLFVFIATYSKIRILLLRFPSKLWFWRHLSFGKRSLPGSLMNEANTRVDLILLGFFTSDVNIGLYALAANLSEGIGQIPYFVRRSIDPRIANSLARKAPEEISELREKLAPLILLGLAGISLAATVFLWALVSNNFIDRSFEESINLVWLMLAGVTINGGFRCFSGFLVQSGRPGLNSYMVSLVFIGNITLNLLLIPILGIYGAAIAATLMYVIEALLIDFLFVRTFRNMRFGRVEK